MIATHITTVNGTTSVPLTDRQGPIDEVLAGYLSRLDGKVLSSIALWRLPEGVLLGEPKAHTASDDNYLQSAGSAEAMTIKSGRPKALPVVSMPFDETSRAQG